MPETIGRIRIVGPGRAGLALTAALLDTGAAEAVDLVGRAAEPPPLPTRLITRARRATYAASAEAAALPPPALVILAVPDDVIESAASVAADWRLPTHVPVLHLSGAVGAAPLAPLSSLGHPAGSLHPLIALSDADSATRLRGGWFAVEGDPPAAAAARQRIGKRYRRSPGPHRQCHPQPPCTRQY